MNIKRISKVCTIQEASLFQNELYNTYDYVRLVTNPIWKNYKCLYIWEVK